MKPLRWEDRLHGSHDLLVACVGYNYGPRPAEKIDEIREKRGAYGWQIVKHLDLQKSDAVLDMGSGCGFIARTIAPLVKQMHCADLNADFLAFCREELSEFRNVTCHPINYADFSSLSDLGINKVYSTAVWIHFNFYDMILNLRALNKLLPIGGTLYFDFLDAAGIMSGDGRIFRQHLNSFSQNRDAIAVLVQYNSSEAVKAAASLTGFKVKFVNQIWEDCFGTVLEKIDEPDQKFQDQQNS